MTTLTLQPDATEGKDAPIENTSPTSNFGTNTSLGVGEHATLALIDRSLLQFDISAIPAGATINSATLSIWRFFDRSLNARTLRFYRLKRAWTEGGVTWNKYDGVSDWQTAGGFGVNDCEQTDIGSLAIGAGSNSGALPSDIQDDISLTASAVQEWLDGDFANNGLLAKMDTENNDLWAWRGSDYTTAANRPKLVIEYTAAGLAVPVGRVFEPTFRGVFG